MVSSVLAKGCPEMEQGQGRLQGAQGGVRPRCWPTPRLSTHPGPPGPPGEAQLHWRHRRLPGAPLPSRRAGGGQLRAGVPESGGSPGDEGCVWGSGGVVGLSSPWALSLPLPSSGGCSGLPGAVSAVMGVVLVVGVVLSGGRAGSERRRCSRDWLGLSLQPGRSRAWLALPRPPALSRQERSLPCLPRSVGQARLFPSSVTQASQVPWASPTLCGSCVPPPPAQGTLGFPP